MVLERWGEALANVLNAAVVHGSQNLRNGDPTGPTGRLLQVRYWGLAVFAQLEQVSKASVYMDDAVADWELFRIG